MITLKTNRSGKIDVYITLSNSDTPAIRSLYALPHFMIDEVLANRAINCNGAKRGKITELVITNYSVDKVMQLQLFEQRSRHFVFQDPHRTGTAATG